MVKKMKFVVYRLVVAVVCCLHWQSTTVIHAAVSSLLARNVSELAAAMCGSTHSCFRVPESDMFVAFRPSNDDGGALMNFIVSGSKSDWLKQRFPNEDNWALNVGFGKTPEMPRTFIVSCIHDGVGEFSVAHIVGAYALYRKVPRQIPELSRAIRNARSTMNEDIMRCSFSLPRRLSARNDSIDLGSDKVYVKLARTYAASSCIGFHYVDKYIAQPAFLTQPSQDIPAFDFERYEADEAAAAATKKKQQLPNNNKSNSAIKTATGSAAFLTLNATTSTTTDSSSPDINGGTIQNLSTVSQRCGVSSLCMSLPQDCHLKTKDSIDSECEAITLINKVNDGVDISIVARRPDDARQASGWYVGFGISNTPSMAQSIIFLCMTENGRGQVVPAVGYANTRPDFQPSALDQLLDSHVVTSKNDMLMCKFTTNGKLLELNSTNTDATRVAVNLNNPQYLITSRGLVRNGQAQYHGAVPHRWATELKMDLLQF